MNIYLLFGLLGVCLAAPEPNSWPYRDSLHPYYYGYPGQTPYVYRASLEDDEEPVERSRQDSGVSVASLIQNAAVKQQEAIDNYGSERPSVVETGSVAPVQERPGSDSAAPPPPKAQAQSPSVVKPGVVNPPAFPPARKPQPPPTTVKPTEEDEDEDDDDDEESAEDEESNEDDEEEEADEERRRNEPLNVPTTTTVAVDNATSLESNETPVVGSKSTSDNDNNNNVNNNNDVNNSESEPTKPVVVDEVDEAVPVQAEVQVGPDQEDDMSDEGSLEGVEAFVPGYVTDQGEVLVPVDTVTGDQPISIVPDPYSPPSRGVPLNYFGYNTAGLPAADPRPSPGRHLYRQDELEVEGPEDEESQEDEDEDEEDDAEDTDNKVEEPKRRKPPLRLIPASLPTNEDDEAESFRYRSETFPPSRSPVLYPVTFKINGGYLTGPFDKPVDSAEVFQYVDPQVLLRHRPTVQQSVEPTSVFFSAVQQRRRPNVPLQVPVNVASPYMYNQLRRQSHTPRPVYGPGLLPYYNRPSYSSEQHQYIPRPTLHNPGEKLKIKSSYELLVEPHSGDIVRVRTKKRPNKKRVSNKKKTGQVVKRRPVATVFARPAVAPYKPGGAVSQQAPVLYRPVYNVQPLQRVPARPPMESSVVPVGYRQPPYLSSAYNEFIKGLAAGYYGNRRPGNRPTPVVQQDEPVVAGSTAGTAKSERTPKRRREAKKQKKNKKEADPLKILKKINRKA